MKLKDCLKMPEHVELLHLVDLSTGTTPTDESVPNLMENQRPLLRRCPYLGLVLATLSSLFFSLCSVIVKSLDSINPIQLSMFRFIGVLLPTLPIVIYTEETVFPRGKRLILILRSVVATVGLIASFYAFQNMPLADASVIVFSVPVFVSFFAFIFLNEPFSLCNGLSLLLTLIGVVLITHPRIVFGNEPETTQQHKFAQGASLAFLSAILGAASYIFLRILKGLHFSVIMTNFGAIAVAQTFLYLFIFESFCMPSCGTERVLVVLLALFSYFGQILLTMSLQMEQAGPVAIARSADIVFAFLWQLLFFNEMPTIYSFLGAICVMISLLLLGVRKWAAALPPDSALRAQLSIIAQ